jgi:hypothetical protein
MGQWGNRGQSVVKIRIYVEGGPQGADADGLRSLRQGFKQHFERIDNRLKTMDVVACGSTDQTIKAFSEGISELSASYVLALLVDADAQVTARKPAIHLDAKLNSSEIPHDARENVFLMVQCMEAWLVTDIDALEECFGQRVRKVRFPKHVDIEAVPTRDILAAIDLAAKEKPTRQYHKIRDGARILARLKPDCVARRSRHARQLYAFLRDSIQA